MASALLYSSSALLSQASATENLYQCLRHSASLYKSFLRRFHLTVFLSLLICLGVSGSSSIVTVHPVACHTVHGTYRCAALNINTWLAGGVA